MTAMFIHLPIFFLWPFTYTESDFFSWWFLIWTDIAFWVVVSAFWAGPITMVLAFALDKDTDRAVSPWNIIFAVTETIIGAITIILYLDKYDDLQIWYTIYEALQPFTD